MDYSSSSDDCAPQRSGNFFTNIAYRIAVCLELLLCFPLSSVVCACTGKKVSGRKRRNVEPCPSDETPSQYSGSDRSRPRRKNKRPQYTDTGEQCIDVIKDGSSRDSLSCPAPAPASDGERMRFSGDVGCEKQFDDNGCPLPSSPQQKKKFFRLGKKPMVRCKLSLSRTQRLSRSQRWLPGLGKLNLQQISWPDTCFTDQTLKLKSDEAKLKGRGKRERDRPARTAPRRIHGPWSKSKNPPKTDFAMSVQSLYCKLDKKSRLKQTSNASSKKRSSFCKSIKTKSKADSELEAAKILIDETEEIPKETAYERDDRRLVGKCKYMMRNLLGKGEQEKPKKEAKEIKKPRKEKLWGSSRRHHKRKAAGRLPEVPSDFRLAFEYFKSNHFPQLNPTYRTYSKSYNSIFGQSPNPCISSEVDTMKEDDADLKSKSATFFCHYKNY